MQGVGKRAAFNWGRGKEVSVEGKRVRKDASDRNMTILSMSLQFRIKKIITSRLGLSMVNFYNGRRKKSFLK